MTVVECLVASRCIAERLTWQNYLLSFHAVSDFTDLNSVKLVADYIETYGCGKIVYASYLVQL